MTPTIKPNNKELNLATILIFHAVIVAAMAVPFFLYDATQRGWNCIFAGVLIGINLALIYWMLKRIFRQKSIALVTLAIVFKYAALIVLFLVLEQFGWRMNIGFAVGIAALFPTLGFIALKYGFNLSEQTNGSF